MNKISPATNSFDPTNGGDAQIDLASTSLTQAKTVRDFSNATIATDRTVIRTLRADDVELLERAFKDPEIKKFFVLDWMRPDAELSWSLESSKKGTGSYFVIESKETKEPIGVFVTWQEEAKALGRSDDKSYFFRGTALLPEGRGKGLGQEVGAAMTDYLLASPGVDFIVARTYPDNVKSIRALKARGFTELEFKSPEGKIFFSNPEIKE
jgi:RimJ/RimL family protein N-acetyltransferase